VTNATNETKATKGYHKLIVWQRAREMVKIVYFITENFPKLEAFGLTSQIRRAAISVVANIVEGYSRSRKSSKEAKQFFSIAEGSLAELEALLEIALDVIRDFSEEDYDKVERLRSEVGYLLTRFIQSYKN